MFRKSDKAKSGNLRKIIGNSIPFVLAVLVFLGTRIAIKHPLVVEHFYSEMIYPVIAGLFSSVSRLIPFSIWDAFWAVTLLLIIAGLVLVIIKRIKPGRYSLRVIQFLVLLYSIFYFVWGFNYFRPGIETRIGWESPKTNMSVFRSAFDTIILNSNLYRTSMSESDYQSIDKKVEESYKKNSKRLGINYPNGSRRPKTMIFSSFIAKLGVTGYFGPFFNEINLNRYLFPVDYPFTLAHEKAHQFGIASEAEANLMAFIICTTSDDPRLEYSGYMNVLLYFLSDARKQRADREFLMKIDEPVMKDLQLRRKYYADLQREKLSEMQTAANNAYLKSNHIKSGVRNYNQVVALILSYYYNQGREKK
jgi:hypothetical protein